LLELIQRIYERFESAGVFDPDFAGFAGVIDVLACVDGGFDVWLLMWT
jgi:hypothetical protein